MKVVSPGLSFLSWSHIPSGAEDDQFPRSDWVDASALLYDLSFCNDVGYSSVADFTECLWAAPY